MSGSCGPAAHMSSDLTQGMTMHRLAPRAAAALLPLLAAACVTGSTLGSGVGDARLEHPPYYAGGPVPGAVATVGHLPIAWQAGAVDAPIFEPKAGDGSAVAALLGEMNAYLDSLGASVRLEADDALRRATPPDVHFGCTDAGTDECERRADEERGLFDRHETRMRLAVGRPSREWVGEAARVASARNASHVLVVTLEAGYYFLRQQGWQGRKVVELGTGHTVSQPWFTSIEKPVHVVQLTGALVDRDGRALRIGAEGLLARRTGLLASAVGAQALVTDDDVQALRTARRDDLPGTPLVWQAALRTLVLELTGKTVS